MSLALLKTVWARVKWSVLILAAVAVLLGAAGMFLLGRGCGDRPRSSAAQSGGGNIPAGQVKPPEQTTPWLPFKKNKASEYTAGFPAGSKVVVVTTQNGEQVEVGILPDGEVVVPEGTTAVVYVKRPAVVAAQIRPFVGVGATGPGLSVAAAAGVDVVRVWRVNLGVGALINSDAVAGAAFASTPIWRTVDARVGGGYGTAGAVGFAGVSIGIE